jgi:4-alpha-glucanotransferase
MSRHCGVCLPLSSMPACSSWGIGEIPDLAPMGRWLRAAGCDELMLLPVGTMPPGQASPYSACSAMAIDPIYLSLPALHDFALAGGEDALSSEMRMCLEHVRASRVVRFADVRRVKEAALWMAFGRFVSDEWDERSIRAGEFAAFTSRERWWLDDYALFQANSATPVPNTSPPKKPCTWC